VKFILGRPHGELEELITEQAGSQKRVTGIRTKDGVSHSAGLVIVACECICVLTLYNFKYLTHVTRRALDIICSSGSSPFRGSHDGNSDVCGHSKG
jgi:hypothetical protein